MATTAVFTSERDSAAAGRDLGGKIRADLDGCPDAVILFASSRFDYEAVLEALSDACDPRILVGSSSAGEFTGASRGTGTACALAIRSDQLMMAAGLGRGIRESREAAADELLTTFRGNDVKEYRYRSALILADALAGHAEDLVDQLTLKTSGTYQFAGGGAGDDAEFSCTHVFLGTKAYTDAVVGLEFLSERPLGIGVDHGWMPASQPLRVTEANGLCLTSLNGLPAADAFEAHAEATGQAFDRADALPFFLHNIIGIDTGGAYRLRVPLSVNDDGSINCAAEVPVGARVCIMKATATSAADAAANATRSAIAGLDGGEPGAALLFDCVATRLRMGEVFGFELESVAAALGGAELVGCNTYGQIARAGGQFGGFHNCTAVVMLIPA